LARPRRVLGHQRQQIEARVAPEVEDSRRAAVRDANQLELLEALERLADDLAVDAEHLGQRSLRREAPARRVTLGHDLRRELIEDLVGEGSVVDGPEGHAWVSSGRWPDERSSTGNPARRALRLRAR